MLEAEMDAIECSAALGGWKTEAREAAGVVVSWLRNGVHVQRGVVLRESESADGEVCPLPLTGELATVLFPEAVFRRTERAKHAAQK